jgi:hypothetical protein
MMGMPRVEESWACAGRTDGAMPPQATAKAVITANARLPLARVAGARSHVLLVLPLSIMPVCEPKSSENGVNLLAPMIAVNATSDHD